MLDLRDYGKIVGGYYIKIFNNSILVNFDNCYVNTIYLKIMFSDLTISGYQSLRTILVSY